ncbi:transposase, partial [Rhizobium cremeum]|nr:transposase [Rhizobium cremeum]
MPKRFHDRSSPAARPVLDEHWSMARRMARELDKILDGGNPKHAAIKRAAAELRLTTRQIYNLLARYRADRTVTSLLPRTAVSRRKRLPEQVEAIIAATLRE